MIKQLTTRKNLNEAYLKVYRNKGAAGVDGFGVETLKQNFQANGKRIIQQI
jgi:RNA-directed DNA polymerase